MLRTGAGEPLVHWSAFDDAEWCCGGAWPEPLSRRPLVLARVVERVTTDPKQATCPECVAFLARLASAARR